MASRSLEVTDRRVSSQATGIANLASKGQCGGEGLDAYPRQASASTGSGARLRGPAVGAVLAVALLGAGCGLPPPAPTPAVRIDPAALATFQFIRDEAGLLSPEEEEGAEEQLRDIAGRSGVFGVVITVGRGVPVDPPVLFRPVIEEVLAIGGEALVNICTPEACGLDASTAHTDALAEAVSMVAPAPEPAPGQGLPVNPGLELSRWVEYVGAVATFEPD